LNILPALTGIAETRIADPTEAAANSCLMVREIMLFDP
jgi:hypothetical protein